MYKYGKYFSDAIGNCSHKANGRDKDLCRYPRWDSTQHKQSNTIVNFVVIEIKNSLGESNSSLLV